MDLKELKKHIRTLARLPEADAPVISCYLDNRETGQSGYRHALDGQVGLLRKSLTARMRQHFEEALALIEAYLRAGVPASTTSLAIFARGGQQPFFLPLQFPVPLPNWVSVDTVPNIYQLVELKDTYHRYVVLICAENSARILGVNLGAVYFARQEGRRRQHGFGSASFDHAGHSMFNIPLPPKNIWPSEQIHSQSPNLQDSLPSRGALDNASESI